MRLHGARASSYSECNHTLLDRTGRGTTARNVVPNYNQIYMAGLMAAPMVLIELALMRGMYRNARVNLLWAAGALVVGLECWFGIGQQAAIGDQLRILATGSSASTSSAAGRWKSTR